ncbi:3'-5' RNA exonuclease complex component [Sporothrix curviconia]|uniref:3'-5' RNA exonuclease complex component n=1 Tax=Sporothrix curviconia TaxID=1260050 RepID=A0ABP0BUW4_9PEZI
MCCANLAGGASNIITAIHYSSFPPGQNSQDEVGQYPDEPLELWESWEQLEDEEAQFEPAIPIRERLRDFKAANSDVSSLKSLRDAARIGIENAMTRIESHAMAEIQTDESLLSGVNESDQLRLWSQSRLGTGADSDNVTSLLARPYGAVAPRAGDLIEVSTDSWRVQLLAVCLGNFRGMDHFYTNTGKWFVSSGVRSLFSVTRFASEDELAPLVAALPAEAVFESTGGNGVVSGIQNTGDERGADTLASMLNRLQDLKLGPSRQAGAGLLKKMNDFAVQSAGIQMAHAGVLDNAFEVLQKQEATLATRPTTMSLDAIASLLLRRQGHKSLGPRGHHNNHRHVFQLRNLRGSGSGSEGKDEFTAPAMYAVYRAIRANDLAFRPLTTNLGSASETDDAASVAAIAAGEKQHSHSRSCLFSIAPPQDIATVKYTSDIVRIFCEEAPSMRNRNPRLAQSSQLGSFIAKARKAIDRSRQTRKWSPYGMVGPSSTHEEEQEKRAHSNGASTGSRQPTAVVEAWSPSDIAILQFIHLWASSQRFSPSSRLHGTGATILRAMDRYRESEYLTMSTGWTFLQEVGWVAPWDIPARYHMGVPDIQPLRTGGIDRSLPSPSPSPPSSPGSPGPSPLPPSPPPSSPPSPLSEDIFAGRRTEWDNVTTYCIDAPGAADIDDGVAIERIAESPDEFWVHMHVADPGSRIRPGSVLAEQAARLSQTAYLQGFHVRMFADDTVRQEFSLGCGQPCLTFSARVNRQGCVLDSRIAPGRLGPVVYITPSQVSAVVADAEQQAMRDCSIASIASMADLSALDLPWTAASFSVGTPPDTAKTAGSEATRPMTTADQLTPDQRADLEILASLGTALRAVRLANGAIPLYWPQPSVEVLFDNTSMSIIEVDTDTGTDTGMEVYGPDETSQSPSGSGTAFLQCTGDPYIRIGYDEASKGDGTATETSPAAGSRLVESLMRLAGEVAADWCHERGIAVPFRGQPDAIRHLDRIQALTRNEVYPALAAGQRPPESAMAELVRYTGAHDVTAVAVPYITMGAARYTKATSPLRRYSDLLVHWQIEGALLADMEKNERTKQNVKSKMNSENTENTENNEDSVVAATPAGPPFTRSQMERDILPLLRVRERAMRKLDNMVGQDQWILQALVRAWLGDKTTHDNTGSPAGSRKQAPLSNLHLTVVRIDSAHGIVVGRLDWFDRTALIDVTGLNATSPPGDNDGMQRLVLDDIQPGQVYPVALSHVDVHGNLVIVRRTGDRL